MILFTYEFIAVIKLYILRKVLSEFNEAPDLAASTLLNSILTQLVITNPQNLLLMQQKYISSRFLKLPAGPPV